MDNIERQLLFVVGGNEIKVSPTTNAETVITNNGEKLSDIIDRYVPVELTYTEYNQLVKEGNVDNDKFYVIFDDTEQVTISDMVISRNSTFSSKKIIEILENRDLTASTIGRHTIFVTIKHDKWVNVDGVYKYNVVVPNITDESLIIVDLCSHISDDDYMEQQYVVQKAVINRITQNDGFITLYAFGIKPDIDIMLDVIINN